MFFDPGYHLQKHDSHLFSGIEFDIRGLSLSLQVDHGEKGASSEILLDWLEEWPLDNVPAGASILQGRLTSRAVEAPGQPGSGRTEGAGSQD